MIAILTPSSHLKSFNALIKDNGLEILYLPNFNPDNHELDVRQSEVKAVFLNPNRQGYFFGSDTHRLFPNIKTIFTASTGTLHVDVSYFNKANINVVSLKNDHHILNSIPSTAELAIALSLMGIRKIPAASCSVEAGDWDYWPFLGRQIKDAEVGVLGLGRLGQIFADNMSSMGARINFFDPTVVAKNQKFRKHETINSLFQTCDLVSLHTHPYPEPIVKKDLIFCLKGRHSVLVNTSRGEVVDEDAVLELLEVDETFSYFTDVVTKEHMIEENELVLAFKRGLYPNRLFITPHLGGSTLGAQDTAYSHTLRKYIRSFMR